MNNDSIVSLIGTGTDRYKRRSCGTCTRTGVRLYRGYGEYLYPDRIRCNGCLPSWYVSGYIPLVADFYGNIEQYFSVEPDVLQVFMAQPEAKPDGPTWVVQPERSGWELAGVFLGSVTEEGAGRDFSSIYPAK